MSGRKELNFLVDALAFLCFAFMVSTGVILYFLLPPGTGERLAIWGLGRHEWGDVHFYTSIAFLAVLSIHLVLHWKWIIALIKGRESKYSRERLLCAVLATLALLAIAFAPTLSPVVSAGRGERRGVGHHQGR